MGATSFIHKDIGDAMQAISAAVMTIQTGRMLLGAVSGAGLVLLAALLLAPSTGAQNAFPGQDKLYHFIAFALVAAPASCALSTGGRTVWAGLLAGFGVASEIAQSLLGLGREGSVLDFLADAAGVGAGVAAGAAIQAWAARLQPSSWAARSAK